MGQYFIVANLDKKQYLHPHRFGDGLKFREFAYSARGTMTALAYLLDHGYYADGESVLGSWAGDRIVIVGDYDEIANPSYQEIIRTFEEISEKVRKDVNASSDSSDHLTGSL